MPIARDLAAEPWSRVLQVGVSHFCRIVPGRHEPSPQNAFSRWTFTACVPPKSWWSGAGTALNLSVDKPSEVSFHKMSDH